MARVRVEEIRLESKEAIQEVAVNRVHLESIQRIARPIPGHDLLWIGLGSASLLFGYFTHYSGFFALFAPENLLSLSVGFVRASLPAICLGSAMVGLGVIKLTWRRARTSTDLPQGHRELLTALLRDCDVQCTVESLVDQSGLPEADLVRSLSALERSGEVVEELDVDTGEYFYRLGDPRSGRPLSLKERLEIQDEGT